MSTSSVTRGLAKCHVCVLCPGFVKVLPSPWDCHGLPLVPVSPWVETVTCRHLLFPRNTVLSTCFHSGQEGSGRTVTGSGRGSLPGIL